MSRNVVVLPQPDGPSSDTNSPSAISRLKSSTAAMPVKFFASPRSETVAMSLLPRCDDFPVEQPAHAQNDHKGNNKQRDTQHRDRANLTFLLEIEDHHRNDFGGRREQKDRHAELADDADKDKAPRRDQPRARQRRGHILERDQPIGANDATGVFELGVNALESRLGLRKTHRPFLRT